ncbi:MAG: MscS family membrane protein [Neptuniibacter pectenicola]|jgi:MscS family membrane protein|uniref:mechanosensitive ion channel family protein n=1 Tax=Neptuniibacter pectenicola TaxID=1806669 RepID=UPI0030ECF963|tara:strand:- start:2734 stop:3870 length:1137 start_codon:yes stop_codon:yes gene_type:complete
MIELLNQLLTEYLPSYDASAWMILSVAICVAAVVADIVTRVLLGQLMGQAEKTKMLWDDVILNAFSRPLLFLIWLSAGYWLVQIFQAHLSIQVLDDDSPLPRSVLIIIIAWSFFRFLNGIEEVLVMPDRMVKPMDPTTVGALGRLVRLILLVIIIMIVMQNYGYSISGILAFGGIGGIAVGFAAKDILANFFGGLMIYLDRPFKVGDWIRSPDKQIEGTVEDIGWRQTRIRTFDKRPLYVPNATFANISVENPSRMTNRRIYEYVGVRYDDSAQLTGIIAGVKSMLLAHPEIDTKQTLIVNFDRFGPSSLDFFIYTFTKTTNWIRFHEIKQDVMVNVMNIIEKNGASIAFPTTTVHLASQPPFAMDEPALGKEFAEPR